MYHRHSEADVAIAAKCGCYLLVFLFNLIVGTIATNYLILVFLDKTIPTIWAMIIGLIGGEVLIPVAIIIWILKSLGVL